MLLAASGWHSGTVGIIDASQLQGPGISSEVRFPYVSVWVSFGLSNFLPLSKHLLVGGLALPNFLNLCLSFWYSHIHTIFCWGIRGMRVCGAWCTRFGNYLSLNICTDRESIINMHYYWNHIKVIYPVRFSLLNCETEMTPQLKSWADNQHSFCCVFSISVHYFSKLHLSNA